MRASSRSLRFFVVAAVAGVLCLSSWVAYRTWPQKIDITFPAVLPIIKLDGGHRITTPKWRPSFILNI
ncbi:MAG: hypothetical protein P8Z30_05850 [Acidobacteriota bacterium]